MYITELPSYHWVILKAISLDFKLKDDYIMKEVTRQNVDIDIDILDRLSYGSLHLSTRKLYVLNTMHLNLIWWI